MEAFPITFEPTLFGGNPAKDSITKKTKQTQTHTQKNTAKESFFVRDWCPCMKVNVISKLNKLRALEEHEP